MSTTAHTPGPWTISGASTIKTLGGNKTYIASIAKNDRPANARLIAAAPDLLEALKALQRQALQGNARGDEWMDEALELTRAAIAKAEGRS